MSNKIDQKITGYKVKTEQPDVGPPVAEKEVMHEGVSRPEMLTGATYKVKPPHLENALYITINNILMNAGTEHEELRPYEIFINSKDMTQFEWIVAITRMISALFRKGGSIEFLIEELKSVFSPSGGYYKKGGKYMNSLVAEIGEVIERHLQHTGVVQVPGAFRRSSSLYREKRKPKRVRAD
jgi:hypothetical protein